MSSGLAYVGDSHGLLASLRDLIAAAERSVVLQMYLFSADGDQTLLLPRAGVFPYADTVADWLIEKKRERTSMPVVVVLDTNTPSNPALTRRKGTLVRERLARAGVVVLHACLFSARFDPRRRRLPSMNFHLEHEGVPLEDWVERQNRWQALHNVEDHRKNLVIDGGRAGALTSHNLLDAAWDWHENLFWLTGEAARALWGVALGAVREALTLPQSLDDRARASLSALFEEPLWDGDSRLAPTLAPVEGYRGGLRVPLPSGLEDDPSATLVEHEAIRARLVALIDGAGEGDELLAASTYFSDVPLVDSLARAASRGARVRVLIDSVHALPLPPAPSWLTRNLLNHAVLTRALEAMASCPDRFSLRVHRSDAGAMMHLKTAARLGRDPVLLGGQANYTPNSFSRAWLETDLETRAPGVLSAFADHFERLWTLDASRPAAPVRGRALRDALLYLFDAVGLRP